MLVKVRVKSFSDIPMWAYPHTNPGEARDVWGISSPVTGNPRGCYRCGDEDHFAWVCPLLKRANNPLGSLGPRRTKSKAYKLSASDISCHQLSFG